MFQENQLKKFHLKLYLQQNGPTMFLVVQHFINYKILTQNALTFFLESSNCPFRIIGPAAGKNSGSNTKW